MSGPSGRSRWRRSVDPVRGARRAVQRLRRPLQVRRYLSSHSRPRLHLGCGEQALDGWLNADLVVSIPGVVQIDARRRLPFADDSFDLVFSEHLIEHFTYEEGERLLAELLRVLAPGGVVRLATPDMCFLVDLYGPEKTPLQRRYLDWAVRHAGLGDPVDRREVAVINNFFHAWGHRFVYDFVTLAALVRRVGFVRVEKCVVGESRIATLRGLESHGRVIPEEFNRLETFVLEAQKPGAARRMDG